MDNATNNDTLIAALSSGQVCYSLIIMLLPYYYATPLLLCYSLTIMLLPYNYYNTNYSTKDFLMITTLLNIEYAVLAISLTLQFRLSFVIKILNKQKGPLLRI
jgi:hypothetical protein